jgi:hypothetical protein
MCIAEAVTINESVKQSHRIGMDCGVKMDSDEGSMLNHNEVKRQL